MKYDMHNNTVVLREANAEQSSSALVPNDRVVHYSLGN